MATIKKFEDLIAWQKAREATKYTYYLTKKPKFSRDFGLKNQIQRSAVSVMANQAEGFSRGTKAELINYFYIAKGSAGETQSHLYVASDQGYITKEEFQKGYGLLDESQKLIESFVKKVKGGGRSGLQHRHIQKEDSLMKNLLEKQGLVHTRMGMLKKEEAKKRGLEAIS